MTRRPALRAFLRAPSGPSAAFFLLAILAVAILAPVLLGSRARTMSVLHSGEKPSADFWLGTDMLGRSILTRALVATGLSVALTVAATLIASVTGLTLGIAVAMSPPRLRRIGRRTIDILLSFPGILLAIAVTAIVGTTAQGAVVAIGVAYAPEFARLGSTLASAVMARDFIAAARVLGLPAGRVFRRHVLPNIGDSLAVTVFATCASALVAVSSLSFLGLGVQPPQFDWGRMLVEGVDAFYVTPLAVLAPAVMIAATGLTLGLVGEALARTLNPVLWTQAGPAAQAPAVTGGPGSPSPGNGDAVLVVDGLSVSYPGPRGRIRVVDTLSFSIARGEVVGVVGESGSGKSQMALAVADLIRPPGHVDAVALTFLDADLRGLGSAARDRVLGTQLAMVFQDPMASLNPVLCLGTQVSEPARLHRGLSRGAALRLAADRLREVHIPDPEARLRQYPHEFSGGMQQRAMIAMGLVTNPALIIADEPTTALDVTVQAQVIDVLKEINAVHGTAVLLISHNIGVIAEICSRVLVMYAGEIVEDVDLPTLLREPAHPYTRALLASVPDLERDRAIELATIAGRPPDPTTWPPGCRFAPRCPHAFERCRDERPRLDRRRADHRVACWLGAETTAVSAP